MKKSATFEIFIVAGGPIVQGTMERGIREALHPIADEVMAEADRVFVQAARERGYWYRPGDWTTDEWTDVP